MTDEPLPDDLSAAPLTWLMYCWPSALDLRQGLEDGSLRFCGPPEKEELATALIVDDFNKLANELNRRLSLCHVASRRGCGGDGGSTWEPRAWQ